MHDMKTEGQLCGVERLGKGKGIVRIQWDTHMKYILSQFWKIEVWSQDLIRAVLPLRLWVDALLALPEPHGHGNPCLAALPLQPLRQTVLSESLLPSVFLELDSSQPKWNLQKWAANPDYTGIWSYFQIDVYHQAPTPEPRTEHVCSENHFSITTINILKEWYVGGKIYFGSWFLRVSAQHGREGTVESMVK